MGIGTIGDDESASGGGSVIALLKRLRTLFGTMTDGTQKAVVRGGAKGATTAADVTSTSLDADHQALDTKAAQGTPAAASGAWPTKDDFAGVEHVAQQNGADDVHTFTFTGGAVQAVLITSIGAGLVAYADLAGGTPSATAGQPVCDSSPLFLPVPVASTLKVYAPSGTKISVTGFRRA